MCGFNEVIGEFGRRLQTDGVVPFVPRSHKSIARHAIHVFAGAYGMLWFQRAFHVGHFFGRFLELMIGIRA